MNDTEAASYVAARRPGWRVRRPDYYGVPKNVLIVSRDVPDEAHGKRRFIAGVPARLGGSVAAADLDEAIALLDNAEAGEDRSPPAPCASETGPS